MAKDRCWWIKRKSRSNSSIRVCAISLFLDTHKLLIFSFFFISAQSMVNDMSQGGEKPSWPLSCYAPAKHEPVLIPGLDESSEELRVKAYVAIKAGNLSEYVCENISFWLLKRAYTIPIVEL